MMSPSHHASDHVYGTANGGVIANAAVRAALIYGGEAIDNRSLHPAVAKVVEVRIEAADIDAGIVAQLVIHGAGKTVTRAVVGVQTDIFTDVRTDGGQGRGGAAATTAAWDVDHGCRGLEIVDAAAI